jgi:hypothetical protein
MAAYTTIDDPSAHFQTTLYTGNGGTLSVTNDGNSDLHPDLVWTKRRDSTSHNTLVDSSRGTSKQIYANLTAAEETVSGVTAFNTDGFTLGSNGTANANGGTFAGWQWKANGGTTASNTDGSITSTVQANQDAGFSIVTYTGTGATATAGHGLGVAPQIIIGKRRSASSNWWVGGSILTSTQTMYLNLTNAIDTVAESIINNVTTSTTFKLGTDTNRNAASGTHVAYCFAEKQGYSKFGGYIGNGNISGPFVYTGFKPAWIMFKDNTNASSWWILDNKRNPTNLVNKLLSANANSAEFTSTPYAACDFLSNGFKIRTTQAETNQNNSSYVYMAFAENPFVTSTGIPATAR